MSLLNYISGLLSFFNDRRIIRKIEQLIQSIVEYKTMRLWTISKNKAEFDRYKTLVDGSLKSVLDDQKISQALRDNSIEAMSGQKQIILIHDPCDIRKKYAQKQENLGKVLDLDKNVINGYRTFNSIAIDEEQKRLHLVDISVYSNRAPEYVTQEELELYFNGVLQQSNIDEERQRAIEIEKLIATERYTNLWEITKQQLQQISNNIKKNNPDVCLIHVLDREFDDKNCFSFIDEELQDKFVIRLKLSRNSAKSKIDEKGKLKKIKLKEVKFFHKKQFHIPKLKIKNQVYESAKCLIEWGTLPIEQQKYNVVRVTLKDRKNRNIFDSPMLLITNNEITKSEHAYAIYHMYLQRSKIEGVFKFIKNVLGWEEFQVRDYQSIHNLIALCFFIGGYFYEIESVLVENSLFQKICELGGGKGKFTRHYFLLGLSKILTYQSVGKFLKDHDLEEIPEERLSEVLII